MKYWILGVMGAAVVLFTGLVPVHAACPPDNETPPSPNQRVEGALPRGGESQKEATEKTSKEDPISGGSAAKEKAESH